MASQPPDVRRELEAPARYSLYRTLAKHRMGGIDPSFQMDKTGLRWAVNTPAGAAGIQVTQLAERLQVDGWGEGSEWFTSRAEDWLGVNDPVHLFEPEHEPVRTLHRRFPGIHLPRLPEVVPRMVQIVMLQLVSSNEAHEVWRRFVRRFGAEVPGPIGLRLPPTPAQIAALPKYEMLPLGVLGKHAETLINLCKRRNRVEAAAAEGVERFDKIARAIRGIGPWTAGLARATCLADPDAVMLNDYNLPKTVSYALTGEAEGDDARMLELLEPYRGHRMRVVRLIWAGGKKAPRRGPRRPIRRPPGGRW